MGGLRIFPLTSEQVGTTPYLTGAEAYEAGLIEVSELDPPEVPSLSVTNLAEVPILLVEGEMLIGGDQNRTMNVTVLCPPRSLTDVPVSCVEAGRSGASTVPVGFDPARSRLAASHQDSELGVEDRRSVESSIRSDPGVGRSRAPIDRAWHSFGDLGSR